MTARLVFESMLIELSKVNAPSLLLSEFNYYFNKAINNYINKKYNIVELNQQSVDDVRVLKATSILTPTEAYTTDPSATSSLSTKYSFLSNLLGATYEVDLPNDYLHLLNCICIYKLNKDYKCFDKGSYIAVPAKRLTADGWSVIINDWYNRPAPERPYYYIHNLNPNNSVSTNPIVTNTKGQVTDGTDMSGLYTASTNGFKNNELDYDTSANTGSNFSRVITLNGSDSAAISTVEKATAYRYGNPSMVRMEIRYGRDNSVFELVNVQVDYIKTPLFIRLTQELMDLTEDTSQIMEFPDYVCQEIINELTLLVMARTGDPLLNVFNSVNLTIANPAQALPQPRPTQSDLGQ